MHLWTIQDAKDGDILSQDSIPFIFKRWDDNCIAYCGITDFGLFKVVEDNFSWCNDINVTPATKEQRGLLFQKMKEAGYGWDAEKKELKEIEPKLTEFEKEVAEAYEWAKTTEREDFTNEFAPKLLDLARKEIEDDIEHSAVEFAKSYMEDVNPSFEKVLESEELWKWKMSCLRGMNKAYTQGKQDVLKDLPEWKKAHYHREEDAVVLLESGKIVIDSEIFPGQYYIGLKTIEKLPKEKEGK
jgi:hypothetical protein